MGLQVFPILSALLSVPFTIKWFGSELFAVFSLAISIVVLFNYLNFGVALSANRLLAHEKCNKAINGIISSSFLTMLFIGCAMSIVGYVFSNEIVSLLVEADSIYYNSAYKMLVTVFYASPLFLLIILFRSILEARLLFSITASNRAVLNSLLFLSPMFCHLLDLEIYNALYFSVIIHFLSFIFLLNKVFDSYQDVKFELRFDVVKDLISSGWWLTVISFSSIILIYADKFIISANIGLLQLAYYVAAYDLISRASVVYGSLSAAFFPAFSYWYKNRRVEQLQEAINALYMLITLLMAGVVIGTLVFSEYILDIWVNSEYAENSTRLLNVLSLGVFFQALAIVPLRVLTATAYEKSVAIIYILFSVLYLGLSIYISHKFSVLAIAILFSVKAFSEFFVLHCYMSSRITRNSYDFSLLYKAVSVIAFTFVCVNFELYILTPLVIVLCLILFFPRGKNKESYQNMLRLLRSNKKVEQL